MRQHFTLVAEAMVAAEVGRMMGDASDPCPTLTVGDVLTKYRLDWGTYRQGDKHRSTAAQHLRNAFNKNPHLVRTKVNRDRYTVYTLAGATWSPPSPPTKFNSESPDSAPTNWTPAPTTQATPSSGTSSLSTSPTTASSGH